MAKSNPRSVRGGVPARAAAKSKKVATSDIEVVEEAGSGNIDTGLAILTAVILVGALVLVDMLQAKSGNGIIF